MLILRNVLIDFSLVFCPYFELHIALCIMVEGNVCKLNGKGSNFQPKYCFSYSTLRVCVLFFTY